MAYHSFKIPKIKQKKSLNLYAKLNMKININARKMMNNILPPLLAE